MAGLIRTTSVMCLPGLLTHEDGMRQLSKMDQQTGIFTMRCMLAVEEASINIVDVHSGVCFVTVQLSVASWCCVFF